MDSTQRHSPAWVRCLIKVFVLLTLLVAITTKAKSSTLYLTGFAGGNPIDDYAVFVVDTATGQLTNYWLTGGDQSYILAIADDQTIRTLTWAPASDTMGIEDGAQYTLDGAAIGRGYLNVLPPGSRVGDSTTDTVHNYVVDMVSGTVYQTELDYTNPVALFVVPGGPCTWEGISYDPLNNSIWISQGGIYCGGSNTGEIVDYSLSGTPLGSFNTGHRNNALSFDPKDGTLWLSVNATSTLEHYSTSGELLGTIGVIIPIHGLRLTDVSGGEFAEVAHDNIPPTTTSIPSPLPNSNGWNNSNVTIALTATDNPGGSGVEQIEFALGGAQNTGWQIVAGSRASTTISSEGSTTLTYLAVDNAGNREAAKTLTVKIDKTLPVISGLPSPGCVLWPPNGKLVQVATVTAKDVLSGVAPGSFQVTGTSNEPSSDPKKPEIVITSNASGGYVVQLQADRLGTGTGRVYTLNATGTDLASRRKFGNSYGNLHCSPRSRELGSTGCVCARELDQPYHNHDTPIHQSYNCASHQTHHLVAEVKFDRVGQSRDALLREA